MWLSPIHFFSQMLTSDRIWLFSDFSDYIDIDMIMTHSAKFNQTINGNRSHEKFSISVWVGLLMGHSESSWRKFLGGVGRSEKGSVWGGLKGGKILINTFSSKFLIFLDEFNCLLHVLVAFERPFWDSAWKGALRVRQVSQMKASEVDYGCFLILEEMHLLIK